MATFLAMASGLEIAQFFGTSSPMTIRATVETAVPTTSATDSAAECGRPIAVSGPASSVAMAGLESMPMTRPVTVMPS